MRARSVSRPSTGVRSSFQSPVCMITPCGVWNAVAKPWGTEWVTGMNSTSKGPILRRSPSTTGMSSVLVEQPGLLDAVPGQAERERGAVDRERQLAQQVREAADVVLVAVGGDAADHPVGVLAQPGEVREDQVDAEVLELGEHQPAVEEQQLVVQLEDHAVAADLAEAAEERDRDGCGHGGRLSRAGRGPRAPCGPRPRGRRARDRSGAGTGPPAGRAPAARP